jgi:hypothetical protein
MALRAGGRAMLIAALAIAAGRLRGTTAASVLWPSTTAMLRAATLRRAR